MYSKKGILVVITIAVMMGASMSAQADDDYYYFDGQQIDITGHTCDTSVTITLPVGKGARIEAECIDPDPIEHVGVNAYRYRISDEWQDLYGWTAEDSTVTFLNDNCDGLDIVVANRILKGETGNTYITDQFYVKLIGDEIEIQNLLVQFGLELVEDQDDAVEEAVLDILEQMGTKATGAFAGWVNRTEAAIRSRTPGLDPINTDGYLVRVTSGTTGSTLRQANRIYEESGMVECSAPDFQGMMLRSEHQEVVGPREGSGYSPKYWTDPNDTYYEYQWGMHELSLSGIWESTQATGGVLVGILSYGFNDVYSMPDIDLSKVYCYDSPGNDLRAGLPPDNDVSLPEHWVVLYPYDCSQGVAAMGNIAAITNNEEGIAGLGDVHILCIKVVDDSLWVSNWRVAVAYDIVSIMAAFGRPSVTTSTFSLPWESSQMKNSIDYLAHKHRVITCMPAAKDPSHGGLRFPANCEKVIVALGVNEYGAVMPWNGEAAWGFGLPGTDIYSHDIPGDLGLNPNVDFCHFDDDYFCEHRGPSIATSFLAGASARILAQFPGLMPPSPNAPAPFGHPADFIVELLKQTAKDTVTYGSGVAYMPSYFDATSIVNAGDDNNDGKLDIDDVVFDIDYILLGGPPPNWNREDADCSGAYDIDDIVHLVQYVFSGGPNPKISCCEWEF